MSKNSVNSRRWMAVISAMLNLALVLAAGPVLCLCGLPVWHVARTSHRGGIRKGFTGEFAQAGALRVRRGKGGNRPGDPSFCGYALLSHGSFNANESECPEPRRYIGPFHRESCKTRSALPSSQVC